MHVWSKVALLSFGGPAGQIAVMHRLVVEEKRWISEERFLHALNFTMVLPGPEAQQLATYLGWMLHGTRGGLTAGTLFILPGFLSILALSILYAFFRDLVFVEGIFYGLKPAVMAVVAAAVVQIGRKALHNSILIFLAAAAFTAIFFFQIPFPLIVLGAALTGWLGGRAFPAYFLTADAHKAPSPPSQAPLETPLWRHSLRTLAIWIPLWFTPLVALALWLGSDSLFVTLGVFFSKMAVVTFGGAYAVLAYVAQQAVETYGWLQPGEMIDGLGMAETTPGPLIQVVQFVAFMGAFRFSGDISPLLAGLGASVLVTWVTFTPCFLWIFLGAPYIERLQSNRALKTALTAVTAAVVGVILNLALWFSLNTLFAEISELHVYRLRILLPTWSTIDWPALIIAAAAFIAHFHMRTGLIPTLALSASAGILYRLIF
ncbi:chromate efflux transporter [Geoalkalibacter halelectricus]|uniref:Chromate efflux transporter n=1 Tax=Geoalkalibacter halelectricus TaxID=2847045 RepID=A0ABY5ZGG8_9BACT|nr:chromate efflux transporter [Geoalkalibacter halelectricus]MDO3380173.1 chromate efflux transporter [Geoalkalibacter halelectricus]UWZ78253.1 chromate efflux transporter [Geoalkalibacter halelectricus]